MKTVRLAIKDLEQNTGQITGLPANPRQWTKTEVEKIAKSLRETPELFEARPIIVTQHGSKYVILGGNLRYEGCKHNKDKDAPCYVIPDGISIDKMKEIVIKDNGSFGDWDYDALANLWDDLPLADWGVPAWDDQPKEETTNAQEEDFDEKEKEIQARCQLGDIWKLGEHRLMCGDSTDYDTMKALMNGEQVDLLLTDPPYNVDYEGGTEDKMKIQNDSFKSEGQFLEFLRKAMSCASNVMKNGASYYIFHADLEGRNFREAATEIGKVRECLIWVKNSLVLGRQDYQWRHEPCLYGWKGTGHKWYNDRTQTTILEFDRPKRSEEHPTMKPIPLFAYLMNNSTKPGDLVLDPFAGSGTSLICAEQLGRRCYTMELDQHYCDVVIARWESFTGLKAEKL